MGISDHKADPRPAGMHACGRPRRGLAECGGEPGPQPQVFFTVVGQVERGVTAGGGDVVPVPRQAGAAKAVQRRFERRSVVRDSFDVGEDRRARSRSSQRNQRVSGPQPVHFHQAAGGFLVAILAFQRDGEVEPGVGEARLERDGAAIGVDGLLGPLAGQEDVSQVVDHIGPVRSGPVCPLVEWDGLLGIAQLREHVSQVKEGIDVFGFESQRRFEARARQREVALLLEDEAEIGMRVGVFRPEAEGQAERVGRLIQPPQAAEGHAVIAVVVGVVGLQLDGQGDQFGGPVVMSLLMSQDAEQVQRPGMLRVALKHAAVQRLGLRELPKLVKSDRGGEGVGGGFHGFFVWLTDDDDEFSAFREA